ncbi:uncharacterized protein N7483_001203 [Penicillium malachiteum]|uniref:uncharacterized protein n=1 Tax=Penicillium malachiteum TaxID=1324776 RepID=UPI002548DE95|nr:uncharacterized protein N7483_001203 [Penicillium malachiteum]KAJ5736078.1 hypothetical protein N7483_001203 [Penicillium malachiteum]
MIRFPPTMIMLGEEEVLAALAAIDQRRLANNRNDLDVKDEAKAEPGYDRTASNSTAPPNSSGGDGCIKTEHDNIKTERDDEAHGSSYAANHSTGRTFVMDPSPMGENPSLTTELAHLTVDTVNDSATARDSSTVARKPNGEYQYWWDEPAWSPAAGYQKENNDMRHSPGNEENYRPPNPSLAAWAPTNAEHSWLLRTDQVSREPCRRVGHNFRRRSI